MNNSVLHQLRQLRPIVISMLENEGRDFGICEYCLEPIPAGKYELHHTKYEGATY